MNIKISDNAERVLLFYYLLDKGLPDWPAEDHIDLMAQVASRLSGLSKEDVLMATAELEDRNMIQRVD